MDYTLLILALLPLGALVFSAQSTTTTASLASRDAPSNEDPKAQIRIDQPDSRAKLSSKTVDRTLRSSKKPAPHRWTPCEWLLFVCGDPQALAMRIYAGYFVMMLVLALCALVFG
ncbi:hypothetical protein F4821DRAFT_260473 [Hypoxylon rubiginosum]|uniref:Uncharacterized protein n=1 Tax=Hypoxylon rubiginosum TaxID=110542 RepID=A0ACC0D075_9PEZI|nr:hypothetical protein F4821DRAFT_260473 [Hypoxylon rubiginosum]